MLKSDSSSDNDSSWLIATCPSCSKQIKAKKEVLKSASSIACPYCQYPLDLRDQELGRVSKPKYSKAEIQKKAPEKGPRKRKNSKKKKIISWDLEEDDDEGTSPVLKISCSWKQGFQISRNAFGGRKQAPAAMP